MKGIIYVDEIIESGETLKSVIAQHKAAKDADEILLYINSIGGDVDEADKVYNYVKAIEQPTKAVVIKAYSAAVKLAFSCDKSEVMDGENRFMIHMPWVDRVSGDAERLEGVAAMLRETENDLADFYATETQTTKEAILNLMDSETYISAEEAVKLGFVGSVRQSINALATKKMKEKTKLEDDEGFIQKIVAKVMGKMNKANSLVLQDENGNELNFEGLKTGDIPAKGDKATMSGGVVKDGRYIIPAANNLELEFKGGKVADAKEDPVSLALAKYEKRDAKATEINQIELWAVEVANSSFVVGEKLVRTGWDGEVYSMNAGEFQLSDGRRIVTDASGVIVMVKDTGSQILSKLDIDTLKEYTAEIKAQLKEESADEVRELTKKFEAEIKALKSEITTNSERKDGGSQPRVSGYGGLK